MTDLEQRTGHSSAAKVAALMPAIRHRATVAIDQAMTSLRVPALVRTRLMASVTSRVDDELTRVLERGPDELDELLGTIAGICAGLRSDDRPIDIAELPDPFGRAELTEAHRWIVGDPI